MVQTHFTILVYRAARRSRAARYTVTLYMPFLNHVLTFRHGSNEFYSLGLSCRALSGRGTIDRTTEFSIVKPCLNIYHYTKLWLLFCL